MPAEPEKTVPEGAAAQTVGDAAPAQKKKTKSGKKKEKKSSGGSQQASSRGSSQGPLEEVPEGQRDAFATPPAPPPMADVVSPPVNYHSPQEPVPEEEAPVEPPQPPPVAPKMPEPAPAPAPAPAAAPAPTLPMVDPMAMAPCDFSPREEEQQAAAPAAPTTTLARRVPRVLEPYLVRVSEGIALIKIRIDDTVVFIKAKLVETVEEGGRLHPIAVKVAPYIEPPLKATRAKAGDVVVRVKASSRAALEAYQVTQKAVDDCVRSVVAKVAANCAAAQQRAMRLAEPVTVRVQGSYMVVSGKAGDAVVFVKAKRDSTKAQALEVYGKAAAKLDSLITPAIAGISDRCGKVKVSALGVVEPYYVKVKEGVALVRVKIGDADIYIRGKVNKVVDRTAGAVEPYCKPVVVKVQNGYLYVMGKVGSTIVYIRAEIANTYDCTKVKALATYASTLKLVDGYIQPVAAKVAARYENAKAKALSIADETKVAAGKAGAKAKTVVADPKFQATAAAATSGAVALGTAGGSAGFVAGGTIGAVAGVPAALFTFGLSIPLGAAVGAGTGLAVGTAAGGTVGLLGGGAVGYGVKAHQAEISSGVNGAMNKVSKCKDYVRDTAATSTSYLRGKLVGGTGGTD